MAQQQLDAAAPQGQALDDEISSREDVITQAKQAQGVSRKAMRDAAGFRNILSTPQGQTQVKADLGTALAGGTIDTRQVNQYASAGLIQDNGQGGYALTDPGQAILTGGRPRPAAPAPAQPAADALPQGGADDPSQPLPVRISRVRQDTLDQQRTILSEFPAVGQPGSAANQKFIRAFQATGSDPRKALQVARVVFAERA